MTMITPSLVPSSDPLVTAASVLEFALRHRQCSTENRSHGSAAQTPSLNVTVVGNPCRPQGRRWWANR